MKIKLNILLLFSILLFLSWCSFDESFEKNSQRDGDDMDVIQNIWPQALDQALQINSSIPIISKELLKKSETWYNIPVIPTKPPKKEPQRIDYNDPIVPEKSSKQEINPVSNYSDWDRDNIWENESDWDDD